MLTITERYMVDQSLNLYNQILFTKFYSLLWKGSNILAAWDSRNNYLVNLLIGKLDKADFQELEKIIYDYENNT